MRSHSTVRTLFQYIREKELNADTRTNMASSTTNVRCRFCMSRVKLATIAYHVARQCPDALRKCSSCDMHVKRKHFNSHKERECSISLEETVNENVAQENRIIMVTCFYCHQLVNKIEIGNHAKMLCPERMATCSQCNVQLRKKILTKHLERCPGNCCTNSALRMESRSEYEDKFRTETILQI